MAETPQETVPKHFALRRCQRTENAPQALCQFVGLDLCLDEIRRSAVRRTAT